MKKLTAVAIILAAGILSACGTISPAMDPVARAEECAKSGGTYAVSEGKRRCMSRLELSGEDTVAWGVLVKANK